MSNIYSSRLPALSVSLIITALYFFPVRSMAQSQEFLQMKLEKYYKDSINFHRHPIRRYYPHRCQNSKGLYGWVGKNHQVVIPLIYHLFPENLQPRMVVAITGKHGVIDSIGKTIIPLEYHSIYASADSLLFYTCTEKRLHGVRDMEGREILPEKYQGIGEDGDSLLLASVKNKGLELYSRDGKIVGHSKYEFYWRPSWNRMIVYKEFNRRPTGGLLDENQNVLIPPRYKAVFWATQNWAFVQDDNREMGLIYLPTGELTSCNQTMVKQPDENGNFDVKNMARGGFMHGLWDSLLHEIYPPVFKSIQPVTGSPYYVLETRKQQFGIGNSNGTVLVDTIYNTVVQAFNIVETSDSKSGERKRLLPFWLYHDNDSLYSSYQTGLWHNKRGIIAGIDSFEKIYPISYTNYFTCKDGGCVLQSLNGTILSRSYYDMDIFRYRYLLAQSYEGGEWTVLDSMGREVKTVPEWPQELRKGFCSVEKDQLYALFDPTLSPLTDYLFEIIQPFQSLEEKYWQQAVTMESTHGFTQWIAWGRMADSGETVLLDSNGKYYTCYD